MKKLDAFEKNLLAAFEAGELKSTSPTKRDLNKFKAASTATFIKDRRINIRLSPLRAGEAYENNNETDDNSGE